MRRRMSAVAAGALLVCGAGLPASSASAQTAPAQSAVPVRWSTYLRAGPGQTYTAIDELEHGVPLRLIGCEGDWCQVMDGDRRGYVDKAAIDLPPSPPAAGLKTRPDCFVSGQVDYHGLIPTRFCGRPNG